MSYDTKYFNQQQLWGNEPSLEDELRSKLIVEMIPSQVKTILEVGCGDGKIANLAYQKGFCIIGVDISMAALKYVLCNRVMGSSEAIPFKSKSFDLVICSEVIEHLPDATYVRTIAEMQRIADRYIIVSTPYREILRSKFTKCSQCETTFHRYNHLRKFGLDDLESLFDEFSVIKAEMLLERKKQYRIEYWLKYRLGDYFHSGANSICPACGAVNVYRQRYNLFYLAAKVFERILPHPKIPRWVCVWYEKRQIGSKNDSY